jgi:hypothetical protein
MVIRAFFFMDKTNVDFCKSNVQHPIVEESITL